MYQSFLCIILESNSLSDEINIIYGNTVQKFYWNHLLKIKHLTGLKFHLIFFEERSRGCIFYNIANNMLKEYKFLFK